MSFSSDIKDELTKLPFGNQNEIFAELAAMVRMNGTIQLGNQYMVIRFVTESSPIARRIFSAFKLLFQYEPKVQISRNNQLKRKNNYTIIIDDQTLVKRFLHDAGIEESPESFGLIIDQIPADLLSTAGRRRAFLRGAFLGGGSLINPSKAYHLELVTNTAEYAKRLQQTVNRFNLNARLIQRKNSYIVYLKDSEKIVDFLNIIGAHQSLLKLEDIRALKELRNQINRVVNCETANISKTVNASVRQKEAITILKERVGLENLPEDLRELCELRLKNTNMSLKELGKKLHPQLGKSGVNHRFNKILEMANELNKSWKPNKSRE